MSEKLLRTTNKLATIFAFVLCTALPTLAQSEPGCRQLGFSQFPTGTIISNQIPGLTISADNNNGPDFAIVFDSANPTGGDLDLGTPNSAFGGPGIGPGLGNNKALGKLLIIPANITDANNDLLVDDPNDDADGGYFIFVFDRPGIVRNFVFVDIEENGGYIRGSLGGANLFSDPVLAVGNNSVQQIPVPGAHQTIDRLEVRFAGSGALASFEICCDANSDSDQDGVSDCDDLCQGADDTLLAQSCDGDDQDQCGTGVLECSTGGVLVCTDGPDIDDADQDGTPDCNELCPGGNDSLLGQICDGDDVDLCVTGKFVCDFDAGGLICSDDGAPDDADSDGIADCDDLCVGDDTLIGTSCDGDDQDQCASGVYDCQSGILSCSDLPALDDSDGDGVSDCEDTCQGDNSKIGQACDGSDSDSCNGGLFDCATGVITCTDDSIVEDADMDGVADCQESCPADPLKTSPGICGCGVSDLDSDGDGVPQCNDFCLNDPNKTAPGICGCGEPDVDLDQNGVIDCNESPSGCGGICDNDAPDFDEDGDGVSNCQENNEGTNPCDSGSFIEKLAPFSCVGVNFFLEQINILTVKNQDPNRVLDVTVTYNDQFGNLLRNTGAWLKPLGKQDFIINDLGVDRDTYGTVCVEANIPEPGIWSGQLVVYKPRLGQVGQVLLGADGLPVFDYALVYPFSNAKKGNSVVSLNTYVVGAGSVGGAVANWVSLKDGLPGDGKGVSGTLAFYDAAGSIRGSENVTIPDGGRFDYAGHEKLGPQSVGLAEFKPQDSDCAYQIDAARYFYEQDFAAVNFFTAFRVASTPLTGEVLAGQISTSSSGELSVVEELNGSLGQIVATLNLLGTSGLVSGLNVSSIPTKGSYHSIVTGSAFVAQDPVSATLKSSSPASLSAHSLIYKFAADGILTYAYAAPFLESAGANQLTEFNSYIGQKNTLYLFNSGTTAATAVVRVLNMLGMELEKISVKLEPKETLRLPLNNLPVNSYGGIEVKSADSTKLVVRTEILRDGQYLLTLSARPLI